ncbi:FecR family protein [Frateuria aurantia]|uniref:Fe2+-dicitrate sensor, membrane component n=1 Tax=Frateuria aurantia (strain ATCC 33424 / DSM 6220 / KCTC 2777 / LMG 1558 / NBRC 3245 / NCIMB 13370) TaxID=767434 RepID=H8KYU8_FRAAD|nr:FecR domain-containing protein [Frateuria aurantia]AFC86169.1 Fe2+-dicitrate sensor, membrane component [Frateuria aurantia DSM 6220]
MNKHPLHKDDPAAMQAAQWWVRLRQHGDDEALTSWQDWEALDPRHGDAFERLAELGSQLNELDEVDKASLVAEFAGARAAPARRRWPLVATAAGLLAAFISIAPFFYQQLNAGETEHFASVVGHNRNLQLADHSRVQLGGATSITAHVDARERLVELQRGQAFFQVQHDSQRPFVVHAGGLSVQATGTAFDVRRVGQRVDVVVAEGKVLVAGSGDGQRPGKGAAVEVVAGQEARYDPAASGLAIGSVDPARAMAWRLGRLEYEDEPLAGVIADLNRYSTQPLSITDPALAGLTYSGTIELDHFDGWLHGLPYIFPLKVVRSAQGIVLSKTR